MLLISDPCYWSSGPGSLTITYHTNIAPASLQRASWSQQPCGGQWPHSHGVAQKWAARWATRGFSHLSLLFYPLTMPHASWFSASLFWHPTANLMPPHCLLLRHIVGLQPSLSWWLVEVGHLCAEPPHCCYRNTRRPLDVNKWPHRPPWCLLSLLGDRISSATCLQA